VQQHKEGTTQDGDVATNKAVVKLQAHFRGYMARQTIEQQYGFKANLND